MLGPCYLQPGERLEIRVRGRVSLGGNLIISKGLGLLYSPSLATLWLVSYDVVFLDLFG